MFKFVDCETQAKAGLLPPGRLIFRIAARIFGYSV